MGKCQYGIRNDKEVFNMDTQFVWREEFNIGVEVIDKEHQRLFKVINKLFTLNKEDANGRFACQEGVKYLVLVRKWGDGFLKSGL